MTRRAAALTVALAAAVPPAAALDCSRPVALSCGDVVTGDLARGADRQDTYACGTADLGGREIVHVVTVPLGASLLARVRATGGGTPRIVALDTCDPADCVAGPADEVLLSGVPATAYLVVDAAPGEEGRFELEVTCLDETFEACASSPRGPLTVEHDPWGFANGTWLVEGWLFHPQDTSDRALRVDGGLRWSRSDTCRPFDRVAFGAEPGGGPGHVLWVAPAAEVRETLTPVVDGACCGLRVDMSVTNTDDAPHWYEWRVYHDTAFGVGAPGGACDDGQPVDGGWIVVDGVRHDGEAELAAAAIGCEGQVRMFSADDGTLRASFEMLPPNLPTDLEFLRWNEGLEPCTTWKDMDDGTLAPDGCSDAGGDNSLLAIWRFPAGAGLLAPGETATASYRVGWGCAWPCGGCLEPLLGAGSADDLGPCHDGVLLAWDAAAFPAPGNGVYHLYRSPVSFADALLRPPLTPAGGVTATTWTDRSAPPNVPLHYVVLAESTDYAGCGTGPAVGGSTAQLALGPVTDAADVDGPPTDVGAALRATGHGTDTADFAWPTAPPPSPDEAYAIFRADDDPRGPFTLQSTVATPSWTDPAAPPRYIPVHVWFYDVRLADACGNLSAD